jgi:hypothetical protein
MNPAALSLYAALPLEMPLILGGVGGLIIVIIAALLVFKRRGQPDALDESFEPTPLLPPRADAAASRSGERPIPHADASRSEQRPLQTADAAPSAAPALPQPAPELPQAPERPQAPELSAPLGAPGLSFNSLLFALGDMRSDAPTRSAYDAPEPGPKERPPLPGMDAPDDGPLLSMPASLASGPSLGASAAQEPYVPSFNSLVFNLADIDPDHAPPARASSPAAAPEPDRGTEVDAFEVPMGELGGLGLSFDSLAFGLQEGQLSDPPVSRAAPAPAPTTHDDLFSGMGGFNAPAPEPKRAPEPRLLGGIAAMMSPFGAGEPEEAPGRFDVEGIAPQMKIDELSGMFDMLPDTGADPLSAPHDAEELQAQMTGTMMGAPLSERPAAPPRRSPMGVLRRGRQAQEEERALSDEPTAAGDTAHAAFVRMPTRPDIRAQRPPERHMTPLRAAPNQLMQLSMRSSTHMSNHTASEDEIARLYREFLQALKACGQHGGALMSFDVFCEKIRHRRDKVRKKHNVTALSMEILIKDGRPLIEIRPRA